MARSVQGDGDGWGVKRCGGRGWGGGGRGVCEGSILAIVHSRCDLAHPHIDTHTYVYIYTYNLMSFEIFIVIRCKYR